MKKNTLYLECYSGISGDMTVAALIDLGADKEVLIHGLNSLHVDGYRIEIGRRTKNSIDACDFNVILDDNNHNFQDSELLHGHDHHDHNHDHVHHHDLDHSHGHIHHDHNDDHEPGIDHTHLHGLDHYHSDDYIHESGHGHNDSDINSESIHLGHHEHRNLKDINSIIDQSDISINAKNTAKRIFQIVAEAESKAHGKPIEEVHFHEVGAVDSIVDIVAAAICLDNLNIQDVIVSELYEGTGHVTCQHGIIPVPVPAVVNISAAHHLPLHITSVKGEMVTPTGAAIAAAIKNKDTLPKEFKILKIGLGAGKRNYEQAGILRAMLIEESSAEPVTITEDKVWVLESNIDDCSGEALSIAMELLLKNGAKDVFYTPIYMKKNRPAYMLGVICNYENIEKMEEIIFTHTTTIGIRKYETKRTIMNREIKTLATPYGDALVKVCSYHGKKYFYPECDSIKELSLNAGVDYLTIYNNVQNLAAETLN
jgi:uncharacterized protein (TIGR00299 family) protein